MSSLESRLRRIESTARSGPCPGCGLKPQEKGYIVVDGNDPAGELAEVCPECGGSTRLHIVVVYEGEGV